MLQLPADAAPRDAIKANKQHLHFLDTDDDGVIVDIDTPERYQYELQRAQR
jgi:CTP:molybdopterin cytidylyltransferase MocA